MEVTNTDSTPKKRLKRKIILCMIAYLLFGIMASGCVILQEADSTTTAPTLEEPTQPSTEAPVVEMKMTRRRWQTGFVASLEASAAYYDASGTDLGRLPRGTKVRYDVVADGSTELFLDNRTVRLDAQAQVVADPTQIIPAHTLYVRTAVNLRDVNGKLLADFTAKGAAVEVTGCDYADEEGSVHMYRVNADGKEGYIMPWYLTGTEEEALANYDAGSYAIHAERPNRYGGGGAADLDYYPREKQPIEGNVMPEECRTLYIAAWRVRAVDEYIAIADNCGINAFVVDITDGGAIGYAGDVLQAYCPSAVKAANNSVEEYQAAIQKLKDAGYYVIGRITTFNDTYFVKDHPEYAICDTGGSPMRLSGEYWPSPYNRTAWQYKVDLAVEAVKLMGFNEIQFDYVRFPDSTSRYEKAGTIDFRNTYNESKAQAIQRFLMYATDILHEQGVYVSADVYGESAYNYVTAYGQYWSAISNVVDAISGMPYPDHFGASGDWRPWEHPYDTLYSWGQSVMARQAETATPAAVRTWIQAYNAIRAPYNTYGPDEVAAQIKGLRDAGCTGGYMTWHAGSSVDKYRSLMPAFTPPEEQ